MSQLNLRIATDDDAPDLLALLHTAYASLTAFGVHFTVTNAGVEQALSTIQRHTTFVLEQPAPDTCTRPKLVGTVSVRFPWTPDEPHRSAYPFIHWFAVHPDHKRQGIGRQLLDHAELHFLRDQTKAPAVYLATAVRHPWLTGLYESRGYQRFDRSTNALGTELVWLRKVLVPDLYNALPEPREFAPGSSPAHAEPVPRAA